EDGISDVGVAFRNPQVDHLLVTRFHRQSITSGHDPVRMLARRCGVKVDHLGLEPEPKLHAEVGHLVHERMQPMRPYLSGDSPVTEPGTIMSPGAEPAVVQHVALNANGRRALGEFCKMVEIMIEVHRLPDIEGHRAGGRWVALAGTEEAMEATGYGVEAVPV